MSEEDYGMKTWIFLDKEQPSIHNIEWSKFDDQLPEMYFKGLKKRLTPDWAILQDLYLQQPGVDVRNSVEYKNICANLSDVVRKELIGKLDKEWKQAVRLKESMPADIVSTLSEKLIDQSAPQDREFISKFTQT
jgi:hypothetical protein